VPSPKPADPSGEVKPDQLVPSPKPVDPSGEVKPDPLVPSPKPVDPSGEVKPDPLVPSPKAVDPSGEVKPAPIGLSPSPEPAVETSSVAAESGIGPAVVDPSRIRGNKHQGVNPDDMVLPPEARFRPLGQTLMSVSLAQLLGSDVLGAESSAVAVQPTDCDGHTTAD
jgi:hypothetical protein